MISSYSYGLVVASVAIAIVASYAALGLAGRIRRFSSQTLERGDQVREAAAAAVTETMTRVPLESAIDAKVFDDFRGSGDGAREFVVKLIEQYLAESTMRLMEVKDAVERGDAQALRLASHSLKGNSGTVGARRMASLCGELETLARNTILDGSPALVIKLEEEFTRVRHALEMEQGHPV